LAHLDLRSERPTEMKRMDKLRNLLVMAASDGSLTELEIKYLMDRCHQWQLSDAALAEAIEYALSGDAELVLPPRESDRVEMLRDLMEMMAADGELAETERNLFAVAAANMGISDTRLNQMIDQLTRPS
jgi:uncharacterized tellurite resistance protein B-like protein